MPQWSKLLKSLGFTDSESAIYLISLEMGAASVQDIAKKANVSRVTTYAVIESLTKHGLMSSVQKGKKTYYNAESPERLVSYVHGRMKSMESTLREVESAINDLKLIQRGEKPVVKLFEGEEGLQAIHDDILKTNPHDIYEFTNLDAMREYLPADVAGRYSKELAKRHTKSHAVVLSQDSVPTREHADVTFVSPKQYSFFGNVTVYAHKVALSTFRGKNIHVLIESDILAETLREMFLMAKNHVKKG